MPIANCRDISTLQSGWSHGCNIPRRFGRPNANGQRCVSSVSVLLARWERVPNFARGRRTFSRYPAPHG